MKAIIIHNHFQVQDGVARSAIGIANALAEKGIEVTIRPLFRYDPIMKKSLSENVIVRPVFRTYFHGLSTLLAKLPMTLLRRIVIDDVYEIEIGFCMSLPIKIVAAFDDRQNKGQQKRFAWMHGYDLGLKLKKEYSRIGRLVCVSRYNAEKVKSEIDGEFSVSYAYNLIDNGDVERQGQEEIPISRSENIQFVTVGRLSPEKGYLRLIRICAGLRRDGYTFKLWIIGDGPEKPNLEELIHSLSLEECVTLLGQQSNPHAYTAKADIFVCSSFSEGYSTACTEAIMLGVPVLTTSVSGGEEIIEEAECGLLVGIEDSDLYTGMKKILDDPDLLREWKEKLRKTKKKFSFKNRANRLFEVLEIDYNE